MCKEIPNLDDNTAQAAFVQGLNPYLRFEVLRDWQDGKGTTEEMIRRAWSAYSGLAPPWLETVGRLQTPLGPTPMELDVFQNSEQSLWNAATLVSPKTVAPVTATLGNPFNTPSQEQPGKLPQNFRGRDQQGRFTRTTSRSRSPSPK